MIKCKNRYCKHHDEENKCTLKEAYIGYDARCESFERGFYYYFFYLLNNSTTNLILTFGMNDETRYCIYYLMRCFPVVFSCDNNRGIIILRDRDNPDKILSIEEIYDMLNTDRVDSNEMANCISEFMTNGLPKIHEEDSNNTKETINKNYGWLSSTGEFIESSFGTHEDSAEKIINKHGWGEKYNEWLYEQPNNTLGINFKDFLIKVKRYALIHDPTGIGYHVAHIGDLTKKQKDFLYGYFKDMGMTLKAEEYIDE